MAGFVIVLFTAFLLSGCFDNEEVSIPPEADPQSQSSGASLGPGVRPLSSGIGEKGSPSWSPSGDKIAFTLDDYVVEKAPAAQDFERRTTKDFEARAVAWTPSGDSLAILGADTQSAPNGPRFSPGLGLYRTVQGDGSLKVSRLASGVQAMVSGPPDSGWVLLAIQDGSSRSRLALVESGEEMRPYAAEVEGKVTGISASPNGEQAILAVRSAASDRFEIYTFSLSEDSFQRVARLEEGLEVFGDPQWTKQGIYYVAGEQQEVGEPDAAPFDLYRVPSGSSTPELAPGVGDDFVASNLKRDPTGDRLAVIGRRNPGSSENLYTLDLDSENLEALTSNEDMQIKTGAEDLTWSADGSSVVIVARAALSEPKVYSAPADTLVTDFYNLYEVPTSEIARGGPA
jgi:Tol biopolymer transport system component